MSNINLSYDMIRPPLEETLDLGPQGSPIVINLLHRVIVPTTGIKKPTILHVYPGSSRTNDFDIKLLTHIQPHEIVKEKDMYDIVAVHNTLEYAIAPYIYLKDIRRVCRKVLWIFVPQLENPKIEQWEEYGNALTVKQWIYMCNVVGFNSFDHGYSTQFKKYWIAAKLA
jgi:hypothetical protein